MAVAPIITLGFGSFGSASLVPTLGFGTSTTSAPTVPGIEWTAPGGRLHWDAPQGRLHWGTPGNRLHFESEEE